jgi:lambda repressor-like predicted transcriptional regulator
MNPYAYPTMPAEAGRLHNHHQADPHYWPDLASEIDTPEEILADELGTTPQVVRDMLAWLRDNQASAKTQEQADTLAKAFAIAVPKKGKIDLSLVGLRFLGLFWLLNSSGESLTDLAKRAQVSKQLLDWHANKLGRELNFHGWQQKAASSRATYSARTRQRWAELSPEERRQRRAGKGRTPNPQPITNKRDALRAAMLKLQQQNQQNHANA